jgi:hypothetical protein
MQNDNSSNTAAPAGIDIIAADHIKTCLNCQKKLKMAIVRMERRKGGGFSDHNIKRCPSCGLFYTNEQTYARLNKQYNLSSSLWRFCTLGGCLSAE